MASKRPSRSTRPLVLIAGGSRDPNLRVLLAALEREGVEHRALFVGADTAPRVSWEIENGRLEIDGEPIRPTAAFLRHDVFESLAGGSASSAVRAHAWFMTLLGWLCSRPEVRLLNRVSSHQVTNKPYVLGLARQAGLRVPKTVVSNDLERLAAFESGRPRIAKPVNGGGYCRDLSEALEGADRREDATAVPAIVQTRLVPPEIRIYRVDRTFMAFHIVSDALDYRETRDCRVEPATRVPNTLLDALARLLECMGLDFAAADFKTCPDTGELLFLEVNNSPMFAAFDAVCDGALTRTLVNFLAPADLAHVPVSKSRGTAQSARPATPAST